MQKCSIFLIILHTYLQICNIRNNTAINIINIRTIYININEYKLEEELPHSTHR